MMKKKINLIVTGLALICSVTIIYAQRTGNIVEYFGKEKVNEISEGELLHVFKKGLTLQVPGIGFNSSSFPEDRVFNRFLMNADVLVKAGDVFDVDYLGNEMVWQKIEVDSASTFSDRNLRSSYVYLQYRSDREQIVLFEASGHSLVTINGMPHEGDHYDFGYNLIPVKLKKGNNVFVLKVGRFPRVRARILKPHSMLQFTTRDMTMPDFLKEEEGKTYDGAIRIINASEKWVKGLQVHATVRGGSESVDVLNLPPLSVYKIPVKIPGVSPSAQTDKEDVKLELNDEKGNLIATQLITLNIKSKYKHHKKTFVSNVDGSVQYYSVAPSTSKDSEQALFLSVHGASVEAVNQANAYQQKDWGNLIAPTNRRPFGFAWEDWGRLDALEVLNDAKQIYNPDSQRIYLTGHSMGGHGTWYLGATYPDHFAAIAPCAGYPDLLAYRDSFKERMKSRLDENDERFKRLFFEPTPTDVELMLDRAGTPSRTLKLIRNYLHHGVYILHGEIDNVVPTFIARDMRKRLGEFHNDFTYYEYPDGTHWYGNHSVDWDPIFNFFKRRTIKNDDEVKRIEFSTGSPGVSASSHYVTIHQQLKPFEVSTFELERNDSLTVTTANIALISFNLKKLNSTVDKLNIDGQGFELTDNEEVYFRKDKSTWRVTNKPARSEKGPHRNGGFKDAFRNHVVFVYATGGTSIANEWYFNKARFDAETFWYKANGKVELIPDTDFNLKKYADRNVVLYGNHDNNSAWKKLLKDSPIQVYNGKIVIDEKELPGNQWGSYYVTSRRDSDFASVGVVAATGQKGMKAIYENHYLVNGTTFPDVVIFDDTVLESGTKGIKCTGFFGNDWSVKNGDFEWK